MENTENQNQASSNFAQTISSQENVSTSTTETLFQPIDASEWSWGGFMHPWFAIIASRRYVYLLLYLTLFIPLLNFFAMIAIHIYFGVKARSFIQNHENAFANNSELAGFIRGYDRVGKFTAIFFASFITIMVTFFLVAGFSFMGIFNEMEDSFTDESYESFQDPTFDPFQAYPMFEQEGVDPAIEETLPAMLEGEAPEPSPATF